ncbi:MAG: hydroxyacid dehydrogenase [Spirochaetales bacterium]|jgi:phosphoglycerate dehydrogenase-like enzyme|nr:hydroxyacid dehydrogenase [Spirochaetales bacterium]
MKSVIVVQGTFKHGWPFIADRLKEIWQNQGDLKVIEIDETDKRSISEVIPDPASVKRLISLSVPVSETCLKSFTNLKEAAFVRADYSGDLQADGERAGIRMYSQIREGFWGQSVAECALAHTLCGLRRIPQLHHEILKSQEAWDYKYQTRPEGFIRAGQFCDDPRFTSGTAEGKKVRIAGAGNIGSRYASFMSALGADVAVWDPFAHEPCFHRAGASRIFHLDELVKDAEIFAPMLPLNDSTKGLITREHIMALPKGCLVVLITRATICDVDAIRERVMADEIALSADVHDVEPLPLDDPLLGRHNVVHTPHIAGRTRDANIQWAEMLAEQFLPA